MALTIKQSQQKLRKGGTNVDKRKRITSVIICVCIAIIFMIGTIVIKSQGTHGSISELMRDAVLHETNKISLFGMKDVNPGLISAFSVTAVIFVFSVFVRIFIIPKFQLVPGKYMLPETYYGEDYLI